MIFISPGGTFRVLTLLVLTLTLAGVAVRYIDLEGYEFPMGTETFVRLFDVNREGTIPTYYSSFALLLCSILLGTIAFSKKGPSARYSLHWSALSVIFLLLSFDEMVAIHESTNGPLRSALNASGFLYFTWVIPGIAFVLIFVLVYLRFLFNLPAKTRWLFLVAGTVFIGGAIGMELVGARRADLYGYNNMIYVMITTIEESLEMMGVVVFIYALMSYMASHLNNIRVFIGDKASQSLVTGTRSPPFGD